MKHLKILCDRTIEFMERHTVVKNMLIVDSDPMLRLVSFFINLFKYNPYLVYSAKSRKFTTCDVDTI